MGVGVGRGVVRRRVRLVVNSRSVPTLFTLFVTFTFTKFVTVLPGPVVVVCTVLSRVSVTPVVVTAGLCTIVVPRRLPTTRLLLREVVTEPMLKSMTLMLCRLC